MTKQQNNKIGVYPGSFDPITYGHIDVVERSFLFLDKIIIVVANHPEKQYLFSLEERISLVKAVFQNRKEVVVDSFTGLLVDYLRKKNINLIIRGLRAVSDFEYEFQMALTNRKLNHRVDTVFLMPGEEHFYISSSLVKQISALNGEIKEFAPPAVEKALRRKLHNNR